MRRTLISLAVTVTGLTLLTGCGGTDTAAPSPTQPPVAVGGLSDEATKQQEVKKLIADCMKEKGFQYEITPPVEMTARSTEFTGTASLLKTDEEVRQYRQRYGYGIYSARLYPDDPMVKQPDFNPEDNPNNRIREALDPARQAAWDAAYSSDGKHGRTEPGCSDIANDQVFGKDDGYTADEQAEQQRAYEKYRTDPAVVKAAHAYGDCLRGKGYQVESTEPGMIDNGVYNLINAPVLNGEQIDAAEAKSRLDEEIKASLADLECRGDYATISRTEYGAIIVRGGGAG